MPTCEYSVLRRCWRPGACSAYGKGIVTLSVCPMSSITQSFALEPMISRYLCSYLGLWEKTPSLDPKYDDHENVSVGHRTTLVLSVISHAVVQVGNPQTLWPQKRRAGCERRPSRQPILNAFQTGQSPANLAPLAATNASYRRSEHVSRRRAKR